MFNCLLFVVSVAVNACVIASCTAVVLAYVIAVGVVIEGSIFATDAVVIKGVIIAVAAAAGIVS